MAFARCTTYLEFYDALLCIKDLKNALRDNIGDEDGKIKRKNTKGGLPLVPGIVNRSNKAVTILDLLVEVPVPTDPVLGLNPWVIPAFILKEVLATPMLGISSDAILITMKREYNFLHMRCNYWLLKQQI